MSLSSYRSSWILLGFLVLSAVSTVYAHPTQGSPSEDETQAMRAVQPRDPRLIPDTAEYLSQVLDLLGVAVPTLTETTSTATSSVATSTSTSTSTSPAATTVAGPVVQVEHGTPVNIDATPAINGNGVTYSATIKHGNQKPIENIQIGAGYHGGKKLAASDLPLIFSAVETELASRFRDAIDSSDELGLNDVFVF